MPLAVRQRRASMLHIADNTAALELNPTRWQYEKRADAKRAAGDEAGAAQDMQKAVQMPNAVAPGQQ